MGSLNKNMTYPRTSYVKQGSLIQKRKEKGICKSHILNRSIDCYINWHDCIPFHDHQFNYEVSMQLLARLSSSPKSLV